MLIYLILRLLGDIKLLKICVCRNHFEKFLNFDVMLNVQSLSIPLCVPIG